jgi:ankyrin repeat protein/predicted aspartyl protease
MKTATRFLLIALVLVAPALAGEKPALSPEAARQDVLAEFTWRQVGEPILTKVKIDEKDYLFVVDTGATYTVFDTSLKSKLGRPRQRFTVIIGNSSQGSSLYAPATEISIAGIPLGKDAGILCHDLETVRLATGRDVRGVIGMEFLRKYILRLDYDRRKAQLLRSETKDRKHWGRSLLMSGGGLRGVPYVPACVQGPGPRSFQIDTGFRGALMLSSADAHYALRGKRVQTVMATAAGQQRTTSGRVGIVALAGFAQSNLFFTEGAENTLGLEMLSRFVVTMDFSKRIMYLRKGSRFTAPDPGYLTGLRVMRKGGKTLVHSVVAGSPAEQAGLKAGDRILRCNARDISTYSLAELRAVGAAGKLREISLETQRGEEKRRVKVAIREMVPVVALHPLQQAVLTGATAAVEKYLTAGGKIDDVDNTAATALHTAAMLNRADMARFLLKKGAKPDAVQAGKFTPLHIAVSAGHLQVAKLLLDTGADIKVKASGGRGNLHLAAMAGSREMAELLIARGAKLEARSEDQATPVCYAAASGSRAVVELLVAKGANIQVKGRGGSCLVQTAAGNGHADILEFLIKKKLDVNNANDAGAGALHWAALKGHLAAAKLLLLNGAKVNSPTRSGASPLHTAATGGFPDVTRLLLAAGAKVKAATDRGDTPLHYAAIYGQAQVLKLLLEAGAPVDARNKAGWSPLFLALSRGREECALLLLAGGADAKSKLAKMTTLHMAAGRSSLALTKLLLARGVALEARDNIGNTALFNAVALQKLATAKFLLEKGAEVNTSNNRRQSPLGYARSRKNKALVELLLKHGAKDKQKK